MATLNPARAVGLDGDIGAVAEGRLADLLLVDPEGRVPRVLGTLVGGEPVFSAGPLGG